MIQCVICTYTFLRVYLGTFLHKVREHGKVLCVRLFYTKSFPESVKNWTCWDLRYWNTFHCKLALQESLHLLSHSKVFQKELVRRQVEVLFGKLSLADQLTWDFAFGLHMQLEQVIVGASGKHELTCKQLEKSATGTPHVYSWLEGCAAEDDLRRSVEWRY